MLEDNHLTLYAVDIEKGKSEKIDTDTRREGFDVSISPDGRWLLTAGDAYYFDSRLPHRFRNTGKVPVRIGVEAHYSLRQPDNVAGSKWDFRLFIIPSAPSALFDWMQ